MQIEMLEERRMMSATITARMDGAVLRVQGTDAADVIDVSEDPLINGGVVVNADPNLFFVNVRLVVIEGKGGDDTLSFEGRTIGSIISGGDGNDQVNVNDGGTGTSIVLA